MKISSEIFSRSFISGRGINFRFIMEDVLGALLYFFSLNFYLMTVMIIYV
jgi:hypothetical protein